MFDPMMREHTLSVAGYIFAPPASDVCSGVLVTKQSVNAQDSSSAKLDTFTAGSLTVEYARQAS